MGQYFLYANFDRREFFMIDALRGSTKISGVGRGLTARALGLLLTASAQTTVPDVGRWQGHRVAAVGDYFPPGVLPLETPPGVSPYGYIQDHFHDLRSTIAVLLFRHDGPDELLELAGSDDGVYVLLAELALHHSIGDLADALRTAFGPRWTKLYSEKREIAPYPATQAP